MKNLEGIFESINMIDGTNKLRLGVKFDELKQIYQIVLFVGL